VYKNKCRCLILQRLDLELSKISLNPVAVWGLQIDFLKSKGRRVCKQISWRL
jgi:hypothetical protein